MQPSAPAVPATPPIAVVAHVFHLDLWPALDARLRLMEQAFDLFVTAPPDRIDTVRALIGPAYPGARFLECENRGRDVAPFLRAMDEFDLYARPVVLKVHTKRSPHLGDEGGRWFDILLERMMGDAVGAAWVLDKFARYPEIGMVFHSCAQKLASQTMFSNAPWVDRLLQRMGAGRLAGQPEWQFSAGTMFWCRGAALRPMREAKLQLDEFEPESGQLDGTLAHAIERVLPVAVSHTGHLVLCAEYPAGVDLALLDANIAQLRRARAAEAARKAAAPRRGFRTPPRRR